VPELPQEELRAPRCGRAKSRATSARHARWIVVPLMNLGSDAVGGPPLPSTTPRRQVERPPLSDAPGGCNRCGTPRLAAWAARRDASGARGARPGRATASARMAGSVAASGAACGTTGESDGRRTRRSLPSLRSLLSPQLSRVAVVRGSGEHTARSARSRESRRMGSSGCRLPSRPSAASAARASPRMHTVMRGERVSDGDGRAEQAASVHRAVSDGDAGLIGPGRAAVPNRVLGLTPTLMAARGTKLTRVGRAHPEGECEAVRARGAGAALGSDEANPPPGGSGDRWRARTPIPWVAPRPRSRRLVPAVG
jgi:hypothetical protein